MIGMIPEWTISEEEYADHNQINKLGGFLNTYENANANAEIIETVNGLTKMQIKSNRVNSNTMVQK